MMFRAWTTVGAVLVAITIAATTATMINTNRKNTANARPRRRGGAAGRAYCSRPPVSPAYGRGSTRRAGLALLRESQFRQRGRGIGQPAGQQLVGHHPQRVDVRSWTRLLAPGLLRGEIRCRAQD